LPWPIILPGCSETAMKSKKTFPVRILHKQEEAEDIVSLDLGLDDGGLLPAFSAGAHIDLHIKPDLIRQYSLVNHPEERHRYLIGVLRDPKSRGGSIAVHDELNEGDLITISSPKNHFPLVRSRRHLLLGGGIGITPILCMAERLEHIQADYELHYCTRSPARMAFRQRIDETLPSERVYYHFDDGDKSQLLNLDELLGLPDNSTHIYACGPSAFIDYVCQAAESYGWRSQNIHFEYFGAELDSSNDKAFEVEIASSGEIIRIPVGHAVTEVLQEYDIDIEVACEQGVCGTCVTRVMQGVPEHRDRFLTKEQKGRNDQFTPCCSRAKGERLILDL